MTAANQNYRLVEPVKEDFEDFEDDEDDGIVVDVFCLTNTLIYTLM